MTYNPALTAFADSTHLWLEVSENQLTQAWQHSQSFSSSSSRWHAYLNQLCLTPFLDWLRQEHAPQATIWPSLATLPSIWEVVNGTAISVDRTRFVLVPTETIDLSELRVPQEWVDIPGWAADYYLAVQVNPDEGYVQIWGYTTHQQLKQNGSYDPQDRTYCLDEEQLVQNLSVLWVARQLNCVEPTKGAIAPLPAISVTQAENLINRLGNTDVTLPRLAVPFAIWGALLEHGGWRQSLYHRRMGYPEQWSVFQWLQTGVSEAAKQLGWAQVEWQPSLAAARGTTHVLGVLSLSRHLTIAGQQYELQVIPKGRPEERIWRFELRNARSGDRIPGGFKLRLLTEDLQSFENNEDVATAAVDLLFVEVVLEPGEGLVWEIEPKPDNHEREILRF
jgi:hypothetical protein